MNGVALYQLPISLTCAVCLRDYWRILNLPDDLQVDGPLPFSCANCNNEQHRYGAPQGMDTQAWIRCVAQAGWRCTRCARAVDFYSVRQLDGQPACSRCRDQAYRNARGLGSAQSSEFTADAAIFVNHHFSAR